MNASCGGRESVFFSSTSNKSQQSHRQSDRVWNTHLCLVVEPLLDGHLCWLCTYVCFSVTHSPIVFWFHLSCTCAFKTFILYRFGCFLSSTFFFSRLLYIFYIKDSFSLLKLLKAAFGLNKQHNQPTFVMSRVCSENRNRWVSWIIKQYRHFVAESLVSILQLSAVIIFTLLLAGGAPYFRDVDIKNEAGKWERRHG